MPAARILADAIPIVTDLGRGLVDHLQERRNNRHRDNALTKAVYVLIAAVCFTGLMTFYKSGSHTQPVVLPPQISFVESNLISIILGCSLVSFITGIFFDLLISLKQS